MEALGDAVVLGESPHADDGLEPGLQGFRQGPQGAGLKLIYELQLVREFRGRSESQ